MVIHPQGVEAMVEHARREFPNEACGILAGHEGEVVKVYPMTNADASPVTYRIDSQEQLRVLLDIDDQGWDLAAVFHSHTHTPARPSPTDIRLAGFPGVLYIIISLAGRVPDIRAFRIEDGTVSEEALEIRAA